MLLPQLLLALSALTLASPKTSKYSSSSSSSSGTTGKSYAATFTIYGSADYVGSGNCNRVGACGTETTPGSYSAAVSESLFGVGPGEGAGPACGKCYKLTIENDATSGKKLSNYGHSIVVRVNNLCPTGGNGICGQKTLSDKNQYGATVNFDLCSDSGAASALFGSTGIGLAKGHAEEVACSGNWEGSMKKTVSWAV